MGLRFACLMLVAVGCGTTRINAVNSSKYYGYATASEAGLTHEAPPEAPEKALNAIKKLKRVAFVPPDTCLDMRAADTSTQVDKRVIRMQCGVTMSELEREAEKAGFDVVTWQSLKGSGKPLDSAKEQKIDLLFEVNELDVVEEFDRAESMEFNYYQGDGSLQPTPLQVTPQDNEACKAYHAQNAPKISGMTVALDLKMVQVSTGSVLWSYRHVENMKAADKSSLIRFPIRGSQQVRTRRAWWPLLGVVVGVGLLAAGVEPPYIGAGVAVVGLITYFVLPKSTSPTGPPTYEGVPTVLCRRPHIVDMPVAAAPVGPQTSSSFKTETRTNTKDVMEERRRDLIKRSVNIFMKQLTKGA